MVSSPGRRNMSTALTLAKTSQPAAIQALAREESIADIAHRFYGVVRQLGP
jgi:hypothetical protein